MRITGGRARGIVLRVGKSTQLRPAADRLRAALFSSLGELVVGCRFLDLFAGTGAYGLEAFSRGAAPGDLVESDRRLGGLLQDNVAAVARSCGEPEATCKVHLSDVLRWQPPADTRYGLIFCDPPYARIDEWKAPLFERFARWLEPADHARVMFEMPGEMPDPATDWICLKRLGSNQRGAPSLRIYRPETLS